MRIKSEGWLYCWAYFSTGFRPERTNLCTLFWRCVLITPLKISILLGFLALLVWALFVIPFEEFGWPGLLVFPGLFLLGAGLFALGDLGKEAFNSWRYRKSLEKKEPSVIVEAYKAFKGKYCPIIEVD